MLPPLGLMIVVLLSCLFQIRGCFVLLLSSSVFSLRNLSGRSSERIVLQRALTELDRSRWIDLCFFRGENVKSDHKWRRRRESPLPSALWRLLASFYSFACVFSADETCLAHFGGGAVWGGGTEGSRSHGIFRSIISSDTFLSLFLRLSDAITRIALSGFLVNYWIASENLPNGRRLFWIKRVGGLKANSTSSPIGFRFGFDWLRK